MRTFRPRWCTCCSRPLDQHHDIVAHNVACANRGERSYGPSQPSFCREPIPVTPIVLEKPKTRFSARAGKRVA